MVLVVAVLALSSGCAHVSRRPLPAALADVATVPNMPPGIRAWGDEFSPAFQESVVNSVSQVTAAYGKDVPTDVLAISGGGANGAFAAGLLCGWSETGTRPTFRLVTGVSVGAIIAPFAFLGSGYDDRLRDLATNVSDERVYRSKQLLGALSSDSVTDTAPLVRFLRRYYDHDVLSAVAAEHAKGRRLYVGTTNLDSGRPVIWDLGEIAASGSPHALKLFQQVIFASASIPVVFQPAYIPVEAQGGRYDEMHVDGGVTAQLILYGEAISLSDMKRHIPDADLPDSPKPTVYIIRNAKLAPEYHMVRPKVLNIAGLAVMTLIKSQAVGDLFHLQAICQRDGLKFRLASIPNDLTLPRTTRVFDAKEIETLYTCGYELGRVGYAWAIEPPGLTPAPATKAALP
jgi:predicted patatin/cPLA2 family phospholipase